MCTIFGQRFGVSVTRAMMFPDPRLFTVQHAEALLFKKLYGLVRVAMRENERVSERASERVSR